MEKLNFYIKLLIIVAMLPLASCRSDPSAYDLKSPCAASEDGLYDNAPCVRKRPSENYIA